MRRVHLLHLILALLLTQFCDILAETTPTTVEPSTTEDPRLARRPTYAYAGCVFAGFTIAFFVLFILTLTGVICKGQKKPSDGRQLDDL